MDPPGHVALYGIPARPCDWLNRVSTSAGRRLTRWQSLKSKTSCCVNSCSKQYLCHLASSSSAPLPSSSSAALPSALHHPPCQQSRSTLLAAPSIIFTPQQFSSVQPPSQDLLSSVRQRNNMSSSQTVGEQPSLTRYLVLGATLESKIKSKICEGGYVDLGALSSPTDTAVSVAMRNNGQPTISLTPMRTSPPSSILEWLRLFGTYASIYLQAHADEGSSLMRYMVASMDMSKCHGGYAWRVYDEKFRRIRALRAG